MREKRAKEKDEDGDFPSKSDIPPANSTFKMAALISRISLFVLVFVFVSSVYCVNHDNQKTIRKIIDWWELNDDAKTPLKCRDRVFAVKKLELKDIEGRKKILSAFRCGNGQDTIRYYFAGKGTAGNGTINGPGKIKFGNFDLDKYVEDPETCFLHSKIMDQAPLEIISTFVNGTPNGK